MLVSPAAMDEIDTGVARGCAVMGAAIQKASASPPSTPETVIRRRIYGTPNTTAMMFVAPPSVTAVQRDRKYSTGINVAEDQAVAPFAFWLPTLVCVNSSV